MPWPIYIVCCVLVFACENFQERSCFSQVCKPFHRATQYKCTLPNIIWYLRSDAFLQCKSFGWKDTVYKVVWDCPKFTTKMMGNILCFSHVLTHVKLKGLHVYINGLFSFAPSTLQSLTIEDCQLIRSEMEHICRLTQLTELILNECYGSYTERFSSLSLLIHLESLEITLRRMKDTLPPLFLVPPTPLPVLQRFIWEYMSDDGWKTDLEQLTSHATYISMNGIIVIKRF